MSKTLEKLRTTIYISPDVLTFLKVRSAEGKGSVSQQLEDLAKSLMPKSYSAQDIKRLEEQHAKGYLKHPTSETEFSDFYLEQDFSQL